MKTGKEISKWLAANCGKRVLAGLTSGDWDALQAAVALTPLISYRNAPKELFDAFRSVVLVMQPNLRWMAYHAIAMELDWSHRDMIWEAAGLSAAEKPSMKASFEPGGSYVDLSKPVKRVSEVKA